MSWNGRGRTFILDYAYLDNLAAVKQQIWLSMAVGARYSAGLCEVPHCNSSKKKNTNPTSEFSALKHLNPEQVEVDICLVQLPQESDGPESELDEMWSYAGKKSNPRWLWHAIDHQSGRF